MAEELAAHIGHRAADLVRHGIPPDEALRRARIEFGGIENCKENCREARQSLLEAGLNQLKQDVRYALRGMRRNPGVAAIAILSLAIGIGANTGVYSILNALLLRPLPVPQPDRLVLLRESGIRGPGASSYPVFSRLRTSLAGKVFEDIATIEIPRQATVSLSGGDPMDIVRENVSANYFSVLGVRLIAGTNFRSAEEKIGAARVAIVSERWWRARFPASQSAVGSIMLVDELPTRVIGIAPAAFTGFEAEAATDLWVNLTATEHPEQLTHRGYNFLQLFGRLRPGIGIPQASAAARAVFEAYQEEELSSVPPERRALDRRRIDVVPGGTGISMLGQLFALPLRIVMGVVAMLLLICCANIANLLLGRMAARTREIATRVALGAGSARLIRQFLTESAMFAAAGGALGLALAWWSARALLRLLPDRGIPIDLDVSPDWRVLCFTAALSVGSVVLFGLAPALSVRRTNVSLGLKGDLRAGNILAIAQVALSVILIFGAGLFLRTLTNLKNVDLGFAPEHVVTFSVTVPRAYTDQRKAAITQRLIAGMRAQSGIVAVSASNGVLSRGGMDFDLQIVGKPHIFYGKQNPMVMYTGPEFLSVLRTPLVAGRQFRDDDNADSAPVAMINEAFATAHFAGENPIGQQFLWRRSPVPMTIVGVARDVRHWDIRDRARPAVYVPLGQRQLPWMPEFVVRANAQVSLVAAAVRAAVSEVDGQLRLGRIQTLDKTVDDFLERERLLASLSSAFGIIALILATVGIYGVIAYGVTRRVSEIALRMALGASRPEVLRMIVRESVVIPLAGIVIGAPVAFAASRVTASLLFGVQPGDAASMAGAGALMVCMAIVAAVVPARRAMRIDPISVLRHE